MPNNDEVVSEVASPLLTADSPNRAPKMRMAPLRQTTCKVWLAVLSVFLFHGSENGYGCNGLLKGESRVRYGKGGAMLNPQQEVQGEEGYTTMTNQRDSRSRLLMSTLNTNSNETTATHNHTNALTSLSENSTTTTILNSTTTNETSIELQNDWTMSVDATPSTTSSSPTMPSASSTEPFKLISKKLIQEVQDIMELTSFDTTFSLWCSEPDLFNLEARVIRSLKASFCDGEPHDNTSDDESQEQKVRLNRGNTCILTEDLLSDSNGDDPFDLTPVPRKNRNPELPQSTTANVTQDSPNLGNSTILSFTVDDITMASSQLEEGILTWSSWRVTWFVLQLGVDLIEQVMIMIQRKSQKQQETTSVSAREIYNAVVEYIQAQFENKLQNIIADGSLDFQLNTVRYGGDIAVSSVAGGEFVSFRHFLVRKSIKNSNDDKDDDSLSSSLNDPQARHQVVWFFTGVSIGIVLLVGLVWAGCRPMLTVADIDEIEEEQEQKELAIEGTSHTDETSASEMLQRGHGQQVDQENFISIVDSIPHEHCQSQQDLYHYDLLASCPSTRKGASSQRRHQEMDGAVIQSSASVMMHSVISKLDSEVWSMPGADVTWA